MPSPTIGLEVHVQLNTKTKLFCSCSTDYIGAEPNSNVCPTCLGFPGSLPVLNARVVDSAVRTALALNCKLNNQTCFHRKNYFYPDLPKAYQISQYDFPIAVEGWLDIKSDLVGSRRIRITRVHIEEDAGKLVYPGKSGRMSGAEYALVDYNRAGVPLIEIVSEPDIKSPYEAKEFVIALRKLVRYLNVSDGDMESGSLRCDANISLEIEKKKYTPKAEIKNMNSLRSIERALIYEAGRQRDAFEKGEKLIQESRLWDDRSEVTSSMRSKEQVHDYRYFPDPDLLPLRLSDEYADRIKKTQPDLPDIVSMRFVESYGLELDDVDMLTDTPILAGYVERIIKASEDKKTAVNWIKTELLGITGEKGIKIEDLENKMKPESFAELLNLLYSKKVNNLAAKDILYAMIESGKSAELLMNEKGLEMISDDSALRKSVGDILEQNPGVLDEIRAGQNKKINFLVGQVMKATGGRARPDAVKAIIQEEIDKNFQ